jgi:hypothetical protein
MNELLVPGVRRLVWRDFLSSMLTRVILGMWGFVIVFEAIGRLGGAQAAAIHRYGSVNLFVLAFLATIIAVPLLWWRINGIRQVFRHGVIRQATVIEVQRRGATVGVWVELQHAGRTLQRRNVVKRSQGVVPTVDSAVDVVLDPEQPERSFVCMLYVD